MEITKFHPLEIAKSPMEKEGLPPLSHTKPQPETALPSASVLRRAVRVYLGTGRGLRRTSRTEGLHQDLIH